MLCTAALTLGSLSESTTSIVFTCEVHVRIVGCFTWYQSNALVGVFEICVCVHVRVWVSVCLCMHAEQFVCESEF